MSGLLFRIDQLNRWAGWLSAAAVLVITLLAVVTALARSANIGSNALLELQWYLFSLIFLLAAGWTLQQDQHVRVDVLSKRWSARTRIWVDLVGHSLVLLPVAGMLMWLGLQHTIAQFISGEVSADAGGLLRWPVWALIPLGFMLLILQTLADMARKIQQLRTTPAIEEPADHG